MLMIYGREIAAESTMPPVALAATLQRISTLDRHLSARLIDTLADGWFMATELVDQRLDEALRQVMAPYTPAQQAVAACDRHIAASFLIGGYTWLLSAAAITAYLAERRSPDVAVANVALRFTEPAANNGSAMEMAFLSGRMALLPDDPAANDATALVLPDTVALREWLRLRLEQHLAPLIAAVYARTGFGQRAQWNLAADACAALFLFAANALGDRQCGQREGLAFVKAIGSLMQNRRTGYFTLTSGDHCETFRQRGGCCLYYKLPGGAKCSTCSLLPIAERDQRLQEWINQNFVQKDAP